MRRLADRLKNRLEARARATADYPAFRAAAVLVPLVEREGMPHVLFTLRSAALAVHSGQISFPGGKCEQGDADRVATALREAEEEIGISPDQVEVLGLLDDVPTPSRFVITPVVGLVQSPGESYHPQQSEVAEVFEVPFATLALPSVFEDLGLVEREGRSFRLCAYHVDGRNIWGATARMVQQLLELERE